MRTLGPNQAWQTIVVRCHRDYTIDNDEILWIEHLADEAAARGTGMEDTQAAQAQQREHRARIEGAEEAQRYLRSLAGKTYAAGKDSEADQLRKTAASLDTLLAELEKTRAEHEEVFITSYKERERARREENANARREENARRIRSTRKGKQT